jgi:AAA domain-containing protein
MACGSRARMVFVSPPCLWHLSVTESSVALGASGLGRIGGEVEGRGGDFCCGAGAASGLGPSIKAQRVPRFLFRPEAVEIALQDSSFLSDEQRRAIRHATSTEATCILKSGAGTGKTTLISGLVHAAKLPGKGVKILGLGRLGLPPTNSRGQPVSKQSRSRASGTNSAPAFVLDPIRE